MLSNDQITLSPNPLVRALGKLPAEFTKADIISYIVDNDIHALELRYIGGDGRLKVLNFAIQSVAHLDRILTMGSAWTAPPCLTLLTPPHQTYMWCPSYVVPS